MLEQARDMFVVRLLLLIDIGASGGELGCVDGDFGLQC